MAFAVVCKSCQSRFLLNDDLLRRKVAGKVVTVRCRQCHATIEVDASDVDPPTVPPTPAAEPTPLVAVPVVTRPMTFKAPTPPRPAKSSTLIGIGGPLRPTGSTELVALSPGLLNLRKEAPTAVDDFPEPPPPPSLVEDLDEDDWEIAETPPIPTSEASPESVDDFIEELPPSIPSDDEPTRMIPARAMLAQADADEATKIRALDVAKLTATAPSKPAAPKAPPKPQAQVDLTGVDVPLTGKSTLPLFALDDSHAATFPTPAARPRPPQPAPSPAEGSLSPAALDPPLLSERPDSARTRRNVVAPATKSVPPAAGPKRRSVLSVPIVLGLALVAGVLIWKRGAVSPPTTARSEQVVSTEPAAVPIAAAEPTAVTSVASAPPLADPDGDITFETNPVAAAPKVAAAAHHEAAPKEDTAQVAEPKPATTSMPEPSLVEAKPEPRARPEPTTPTEPVGDFDPAAAAAALTAGAAQASSCRKEGDPSGVASVVITFAPSGRVTSANISGPPYAGTPTGGCIAAVLRKAHVPPFDGDRVTVSKTIVIQ
jgi:predicted Zn finger-like uncharacterized protein